METSYYRLLCCLIILRCSFRVSSIRVTNPGTNGRDYMAAFNKFKNKPVKLPKTLPTKESYDPSKRNEVSDILDRVFLEYDSRLRPNYGGPPTLINVTVLLGNLGPISEVEMNFRLDMSIRQRWNDPRLAFEPSKTDSEEELILNYEFTERIWVPDLFFPESIHSFKHEVMQPNTLVRLYPNGDILISSRVTVISKCPMDLSFFPIDLQRCSLLIESYGYTVDDVLLLWSKRETTESSNYFETTQFDLLNITTSELQLEFSTGRFSDLKMDFLLKRNLTYFILQIYLPSTMIVMLSWVSFWISRYSIPARAALSITTVLTMITLIGTTNSTLPRVSNVKALDIHFAICLIFVFGALLEFAAVSYFNKVRFRNPGYPAESGFEENYTLQQMMKQNQEQELERYRIKKEQQRKAARLRRNHTCGPCYHDSKLNEALKQLRPVVDISLIDIYSRAFFPAAYVLVTLIYWIGYTNALYAKFRWNADYRSAF